MKMPRLSFITIWITIFLACCIPFIENATDSEIKQQGARTVDVRSVKMVEERRCFLPPKVVGDCRALIKRWSYILKSNKCVKFYYGGCKGNKNNFATRKKCRKTCVDVPLYIPF